MDDFMRLDVEKEPNELFLDAQADMFARCLLMPEKQFTKWFYKSDGDIDFLAKIFVVERRRIAKRITDLDLWED